MAGFLKNIKDKLIEDDSLSVDVTDELDIIRKEYLEGDIPTFNNIEESNVDMNTLTLIADIYEQLKLDENKSIFKVEELKSTLPNNLSTETKKATVLGMFPIIGLNLDQILMDASERTNALLSTKTNCMQECDSKIKEDQITIAELETRIEELKVSIQEQEKLKEDNIKIIDEEINRINAIKSFII